MQILLKKYLECFMEIILFTHSAMFEDDHRPICDMYPVSSRKFPRCRTRSCQFRIDQQSGGVTDWTTPYLQDKWKWLRRFCLRPSFPTCCLVMLGSFPLPWTYWIQLLSRVLCEVYNYWFPFRVFTNLFIMLLITRPWQ